MKNQPIDWYDEPQTSKKPFPKWLRLVLISLFTGVGAGLLTSICVIFIDYISRLFFHNPINNPSLDFKFETLTILLVLIMGASLGFVLGAPTALIFGTLSIRITKNFNARIRYILRIILGIIASFLAFFIFGLIVKQNIMTGSVISSIIIPMLAGIFGTIIFLWLYDYNNRGKSNDNPAK